MKTELGDLRCDVNDKMDWEDSPSVSRETSGKSDSTYVGSQPEGAQGSEATEEDTLSQTPAPITLEGAFKAFVVAAGVTRGTDPSPSFMDNKLDSQKRKVTTIRKLLEKMYTLMAPGSEDFLRSLVIKSLQPPVPKNAPLETKFNALLTGVGRQYEKAEGRRDKELVLATIAEDIPYRDIVIFIPGLSEYKYTKAKKYAMLNNRVDPVENTRERYQPVFVNHFLMYITR